MIFNAEAFAAVLASQCAPGVLESLQAESEYDQNIKMIRLVLVKMF